MLSIGFDTFTYRRVTGCRNDILNKAHMPHRKSKSHIVYLLLETVLLR
jgi:hypothetical protein